MSEDRVIINIAKQFSLTPGPRFIKQGSFSGEAFRRKLLVPALSSGAIVCVILDGTAGIGSSFIDEAFGGLVRSEGFDRSDVLGRITIESAEDPMLIEDAVAAINDAQPA
jgi:hypothetical protein